MPGTLEWLQWAPLSMACLHVFEEFVWPGGFLCWYRAYRGGAATVNRRFLVIINAGLLVTLLEGALAGSTLFGTVVLLAFSGVMFSNGCWHLVASYKSHSYSPGMVTGTLFYLALPFFQYVGWIGLGRISPSAAVAVILSGATYPLWSALYHRKRMYEPSLSR